MFSTAGLPRFAPLIASRLWGRCATALAMATSRFIPSTRIKSRL
jgi:hypothetical protein